MRRCPERIPVLPELTLILRDVLFFLSSDSKLGISQQIVDVLRYLDLSGVRTSDCMNERVVRALSAKHRFGAHCCANLSEQSEVDGIMQGKSSYRGREGRAVKDTEMFLGGEW